MSRESDTLIYALDESGALVHVDSVANGLACKCVCPSCGQPLVAKNGGKKLVHHFAHRSAACDWAAEVSVTMLVHEIIRAEGQMFAQGAGYWDYCNSSWCYFSPCGMLDVRAIGFLELEGQKAPALKIGCVDERGCEAEFVLMVSLAGYVPGDLYEQLHEEGANVLVLNLKGAYASMRHVVGRHFNRREFFARVQDPTYLRSVLLGASNPRLLRWLSHPIRDTAEAEAEKRRREQFEARWRAVDHEAERRREERRLEDERERNEKEHKRIEARQRAIEAERLAFEDEGVESLPKVKRGEGFCVDECPLLGQADVAIDCGAYEWSPNRCIFFEGQRYYLIGCTARQNGIGLGGE